MDISRFPDAYKIGYIPKELNTLRFKQGLPSQLIANSCMNDSVCSSDLYRDIDDTTRILKMNNYTQDRDLCESCNKGLCNNVQKPQYQGLCNGGCLCNCPNMMYYEPVVPINRGLCPPPDCPIQLYNKY
jgi:hypothetical protein